jgi:hypothetical protein
LTCAGRNGKTCALIANEESAMSRPMLALAGLSLTVALPVQAKDRQPDIAGPAPAVFQAVLDCKPVADPAARLACFDKAVGALNAARDANELVVTDRATVREAKKGLFGLALPSLKLFGDGKDEEVTEIESKIVGIRLAGDGFPTFTLEDGARWKQTDGRNTYPKPGQKIRIRKAALGSYMASINDQPGVRVVRQAN